MQTITTTYHGPTNTRGSRITARCDAGRITIDCDGSVSNETNHDRAAYALLAKLGWIGSDSPYYHGTTHDGRRVYVLAIDGTRLMITPY